MNIDALIAAIGSLDAPVSDEFKNDKRVGVFLQVEAYGQHIGPKGRVLLADLKELARQRIELLKAIKWWMNTVPQTDEYGMACYNLGQTVEECEGRPTNFEKLFGKNEMQTTIVDGIPVYSITSEDCEGEKSEGL